jgi:muramidase (phage lysozyme)
MAELKAQTSAAGYAMGQQGNSLKSYYGALLENPNVQRGLATLKATEGTLQKPDPYASGFGNTTLSSFTDHPGVSYGFTEKTGKKNKTTAAGAYQFLSGTWKGLKNKLGLPDFSPLSQDIAALGLIDEAGGLAALVSGDVKGFVSKVGGKWASLPSSTVSQMHRSWGFVEDAWNNALNPNKDALPGTAPTPYGPDSQQAWGATRPDNYAASGPKGLFSVNDVSAPVGHVSRSPLGPVSAPSLGSSTSVSRPDNANYAGPKGSFSIGAPSKASLSPDRPDNHAYAGPVGMGGPGGNYVDAASAAAATAATSAAASAERAAARAAPAAAPSAPSRPDNANYTGPKGLFSVDPSATISGVSVAPAGVVSAPASTVSPAAPSIGMPTAPVARPALAPVPAAVAPKPTVAVAPPAPSYSRQAVAPAHPALSPADVYGGTVGTAQTSTPGTTVSRATSYGPTYTTNKFGAVTATAPDGTQMAAWGGVPSQSAISGPLGTPGIASQGLLGGAFGPKAKSATGTLAGAAIGGYALGPLGAMLGGLIGKNIAQGKAPLGGLLGNNARTVNIQGVPTQFASPIGGLGFPSAPNVTTHAVSTRGGNGGLSSQARDALGTNDGLY